MNKYLMLWPDVKEDIPKLISTYYDDCVDIKSLYKKSNILQRFMRKLMSKYNISTKCFLESWVEQLDNYDLIILHANPINRSVPRTLRKIGYTGRIIYWYWNPVADCILPNRINRKHCEIWSFSKEDCIKYNLKYNSTYFWGRFPICKKEQSVDLFFVGLDKGRYKKINELKVFAKNNGITTDFHIIKDSTSSRRQEYQNFLKYDEVLKRLENTRVIVEFLQEGQTGLSLRTMESIFYGKKLITDNKNIIHEDFYCKSNIYLMNKNNYEGLKEFLDMPYIPVDEKMLDYYDFANWIKRFE